MWIALVLACSAPDAPSEEPWTVVTFNVGTTLALPHGDGDDYTAEEAARSDTWYGNGLAWRPAIDAVAAFFAETRADVVGFQEIFDVEECAGIPASDTAGFVCEEADPTARSVAERVLGVGWQIECHPGKPDKCIAVHERRGDLEPLEGYEVDGCGSGARVARGRVTDEEGTVLTIVHVHGTSGFDDDDAACRVAQADQVLVDLGDGEPSVDGERNLVLGDLNTDPGRFADRDPSAVRWAEAVDIGLRWHTATDPAAPATYLGVASIDHVISDTFVGDCVHPGVDPGSDPVFPNVYFDHAPVVCRLREHERGGP